MSLTTHMLLSDPEYAATIIAPDNAVAPPPMPIIGLTSDSRQVQPGYLFAAWPGVTTDGRAFVDQAVERGATVVVLDDDARGREMAHGLQKKGITTVLVRRSARWVMARVAAHFYGTPGAAMRAMVGITGTNGKTTSSYLIEGVLAAAGYHPGVIGTLGARYGAQHVDFGLTTPDAIGLQKLFADMRAGGCDAIAMEVSSHALDQDRVAGVDYDVAVWTNLTHDHLDYHPTLEAYCAAKGRLLSERLKVGGHAVINQDDPMIKGWVDAHADVLKAKRITVWPIGLSQTESWTSTREGVTMRARVPHTTNAVWTITSPLVGAFNVENILGAVGVGWALGLSHDEVQRGIAAVRSVPGRLERVDLPEFTSDEKIDAASLPLVVVDYAHTPDALHNVLTTMRAVTQGRVLCVFGCGGDRDPYKRAPMGRIAAQQADWSVLTSDNPRTEDPHMIADAVEQGLAAGGAVRKDQPAVGKRGYTVMLDRHAAIQHAIRQANAADVIVIAGKGHETVQIVGMDKRYFDDREEARSALRDWIRDHP